MVLLLHFCNYLQGCYERISQHEDNSLLRVIKTGALATLGADMAITQVRTKERKVHQGHVFKAAQMVIGVYVLSTLMKGWGEEFDNDAGAEAAHEFAEQSGLTNWANGSSETASSVPSTAPQAASKPARAITPEEWENHLKDNAYNRETRKGNESGLDGIWPGKM